MYETAGTQFSSYEINLDVIDSYALNFIKTNHVSEMLLYIVHNHPFLMMIMFMMDVIAGMPILLFCQMGHVMHAEE